MLNSRIENIEYKLSEIHKRLDIAIALQEHTSGKVDGLANLIFNLEEKLEEFEDKYNY